MRATNKSGSASGGLSVSTACGATHCKALSNSLNSENLKHERQITIPGYHEFSQMFGVSLDRLMGEDGLSSGIPRAVKDCVEDIRSRGTTTPSISVSN